MQAQRISLQQRLRHLNSTSDYVEKLSYEALKQEAITREKEKNRALQIEHYLQAIPARFKDKTWSDYQINYPEQVLSKKIAESFTVTFTERLKEGTCLKFLGKAGTGKTLLALIIYQALVHAGLSVRYESSLHFLRQFQETEFESYAAFQAHLATYQRIQLLILDEISLGVGKGGMLAEWQRNHLYTLINQRYVNRLPTLVISNHGQDELIERLGEPIVGRLSENGLTIAFNWASYR